jgi:5-methylcytosine-specific restriction enzyme subunit McrC
MTLEEATALQALGRKLASKKEWWGGEGGDEEERETTVVRVTPRGSDHWEVRVSDAVGVVSVGSVQLVVQPKIPLSHLLYLFWKSGEFPRLEEQASALRSDSSLWELVATWLVAEMERVIRRDLIRDYVEDADDLPAARGRIEPTRTAHLFYTGELKIACEFDEFASDTRLNRVLKAALGAVAGSALLPSETRRRAIRVMARMDEVTRLRPSDLSVRTDRRSAHYTTGLQLARHVLQREGRTISAGNQLGWTFLIRTPEMVEAGIREVLAEHLGRGFVRKEGRQATGSSLTFNPDLVFGADSAVADVKYKLSHGEWTRSDLYQVIAFSEAFGTDRGAVIQFRGSGASAAPEVWIGDKVIREVTWAIDARVLPELAGAALASEVAQWLGIPVTLSA